MKFDANDNKIEDEETKSHDLIEDDDYDSGDEFIK